MELRGAIRRGVLETVFRRPQREKVEPFHVPVYIPEDQIPDANAEYNQLVREAIQESRITPFTPRTSR